MNIEIQDVSASRKTLVVTLDKSEVEAVHRSVVAEIAKVASLPGFRPGKAPAAVVEKRYAKEIEGEFKTKVVNKAYSDGLEQSKLEVFSVVDVKEGVIEPSLSAAVTFTVDLRPEFPVPEYKGLSTEIGSVDVTDAEVDAAVEGMRAERADFKVVERASQKADYVKLAYEGKIGEQAVADLVPDRTIFGKAPQTWEEVEGNEGLIPGLGQQIAGLAKGDKKDVQISFPADFHVTELAGKEAVYAIEVLEVREKVLPELDEAFLKGLQVETVDALKSRTRDHLKYRKEMDNRAAQRQQVTEKLAAGVDFEIPQTLVESETQNILRRFMEENLRRGVPQDAFEKNKEQLFEDARKAAARNAKVQLILARIAAEEKIELKDADYDRFIRMEAMRSGERPEKLVKELGKDRERLRAMQQQMLLDKALDFVVSQATVVPAPAKA
ncbi:MAG TPA: trigger factor [Opitutaceae bacterium]|nr:trigger factor [Opitutaceae bacterium]